jgi:hypothetical protein
MANTIDTFRAKINPARANQFKITIQFPVFLGGKLATEQFEFHCQSTVIPSGTTGTVEIDYKGSKLKLAGDNTYASWGVTVLNNKDFNIYKTIQRWREFQRSDILGTRAPDLTYKTVATIEQLDAAETVIFTEILVGLFPTTVGDITLGQGENDSVEMFDVTFEYDYTAPELI